MSNIPSARAPKSNRNVYDILPDGDYEARLSRFVGVGIQDQRPYKGQAKDPAFKCFMTFELIGVDATGKKEDGTPLEPSPACQFADFALFPGASRGKVFDLCQSIDPSVKAVPKNMDWFREKLGAVVNVRVGSYTNAQGQKRNSIQAITSVPAKYQAMTGPARLDTVFFDPYVDSVEMFEAYGKIYNFQRDDLAKAHDAANMPFAGKEAPRMEQSAAPSRPSAPAAQQAPVNNANPFAGGATPNDMPFDDDIPFAPIGLAHRAILHVM